MGIPNPYAWDSSFRTTYNQIDDDHKTLFNGIFNLAREDTPEHLADLRRATGKHFLNEQKLMLASQYAEYDEHLKAHNGFLAKLDNWNGDIDYCKKWLCDHIKTIDFKYKGKI